MECNRDEALRSREIAESKFTAKDIDGAKKFALKAQSLYPGLDGISQMVATLDVYLSAQSLVNGEKDWYSILSVNVSADDEMVKKQYRKLALMLHPDKNKSIGAEGAFKLISEAWSVLSDKTRRMAYDKKRNVKGHQQRAAHTKRDPSCAHSTNGFFNFANSAASRPKIQKSTSRAAPSAVPHPNTFWTVCNRCKMQYEYLRVYLNHNLLCPTCHEPFLAVEIPIPTNGPNTANPWATQQCQQTLLNHNNTSKNTYGPGKSASAIPGMRPNGFQHGSNCDSYNNPNFQWGAFSRTAGAASAAASFSAATQTVNMVHQTYEKVRKERKEAEAAAKKLEAWQRKTHVSAKSTGAEFSGNPNAGFTNNALKRVCPNIPKEDRPVKKRSIGDDGGSDYMGGECEEKTIAGNANKVSDSHIGLFEIEGAGAFAADSGKVRSTTRKSGALSRELSHVNIRNMLMHKAKVVVRKKLEELNSAATVKLAEKDKAKQKQKQKENNNGREKSEMHADACDVNKMDASGNKEVPDKMETPNTPHVEANGVIRQPISMDVPDPDFHDFDMDRSERCFEADQVWATYDDEDGMPRLYVMIQKVSSLKPFKVRLSFLNSKGTTEFGQLNWIASGFAKTCGDFRIGSHEIRDTVNIFSHQVRWENGLRGAIRWEKGLRGTVRIVPRKHDIWALYRNWSPDWNENTPDEVIYKYDMVEVLEDYTEEGLRVIPLVKVAGFKAVFHPHVDPNEARRIPREEMFRFSHQVPCYMLTGEEAKNAPKGCCELDPAATPLELLQVITEAEEQVAETVEQPSAT
uniref:DnaJ subfamily B member 14 n=1 Tax=Anthurium amnicola TaxID=1678845 RepID=A0A1D1YGL1_9ARAE